MIADDAQHVLPVGGEAGERSQVAGQLGGGRVALAGHQRRQRARVGAGLIRVVRHAEQHQHRAQIGVAESEGAVVVGQPRDLFAGELRHQHADLEHDRPEPDRVAKGVDVELAGFDVEELEQVQATPGCRPCCRGTCTRSRGCWR